MPGIIRDFTVCSKFHTHARPNWPIKKWQTKASWISRQQWRYRRRSSNNPIFFFFFLFKISLETKIIIHNRDGKPSANIGSWDEKKQNRLIQFFFLFFFRKNLKSAHSPDLFFFGSSGLATSHMICSLRLFLGAVFTCLLDTVPVKTVWDD